MFTHFKICVRMRMQPVPPDQQCKPSKSSPHAWAIFEADLLIVAAGHNGDTQLRPRRCRRPLTCLKQDSLRGNRSLPPVAGACGAARRQYSSESGSSDSPPGAGGRSVLRPEACPWPDGPGGAGMACPQKVEPTRRRSLGPNGCDETPESHLQFMECASWHAGGGAWGGGGRELAHADRVRSWHNNAEDGIGRVGSWPAAALWRKLCMRWQVQVCMA